MDDENPKDDVQIMFPEREVAGYKVRPWSLGKFVALVPVLVEIRETAKARGLEWSLEAFSVETVLDFVSVMGPHVSVVLSKSLDIPVEEAEGLSIDRATTLLMVVIQQNLEQLKNSLGLGRAWLRAMNED